MKFPKPLQLLLITFGSIMMAISLALFLIPAKITAGGVSGIATILYHLANFPAGIVMLGLNIPLFLIGLRFLGKNYGIRTVIGIILSSIFTDLLAETFKIPPVTQEPLLAAIFGGMILGIGLGMIFRAGGSTGGSDILGGIITKYSNMSLGQSIMFIDVFIIAATGFAFTNANLALYGIISLGISAYAIDRVIEGFSYARVINIITDHPNEIAQKVIEKMNRSATITKAEGAFTGNDKYHVKVVLSKKELPRIKSIILDTDEDAFSYVSDVFAVMGKGFKSRGIAF
ncbi:MAG: YitT family protein [Candidatus Zixiibacteriota bacterium]